MTRVRAHEVRLSRPPLRKQPASVRPCGYCGDTIAPKWPKRSGRPPKYHPKCAQVVKGHEKVTARYNRCLANGGHKPSSKVVERPGNLVPLRVCASCDVPYKPPVIRREPTQ